MAQQSNNGPGTALAPIAQELGSKVTQFGAALTGTGIDPKRFIRVVMTAINLNPDLLNCDRRSLMNAAMKAASDGLVPDGTDGALVPFDGKVTWMPMVAGVRKKVRRSGEVTSWDVTAVHAKDVFDYELGDEPFIKHKPYLAPPLERGADEDDASYNQRLRKHLDHGPLTHVYSVANIKGGDKSRDVMSRAEVELVRDMYARKNRKNEFSPAWRRSFDEMAKKTIARRHAKQLPMSTDIIALLTRDDDLYDLGDRNDRIQAPRALSARLDVLAGVDPETGEFQGSEDGVSTPPFEESAAPDDNSGVGAGIEGAAQHFEESEAGRSSAEDPPGTSQGPQPGVSGGRKGKAAPGPDLLSPPLEERGEAMAKRGRPELDRWINELPADDMAKVSLGQLKAWRAVADKVAP